MNPSMERGAVGERVGRRWPGMVSAAGSIRMADVAEYPELRQQMLRLAAGVSALERQIDAAISGARQQVRETERELRRANFNARSL